MNLRNAAISEAFNRETPNIEFIKSNISEYFGSLVFSLENMKRYLSKETFKTLEKAVDSGENINRSLADEIAVAMKTWALEKGATHYTHWFQPLTGLTAEKHDSFFELKDGGAIETFSGSSLIQQEPDASSFPNGGIRSTFEARGYTAWDPSSPAFLMVTKAGYTLCIPTIFISYTGEALDYKAPLLRSIHYLEENALNVVQLFNENTKKVSATLGVEQEYFLIDAALYNARPDLKLARRTVFGHSSAKGQQLEDHYFGSIPERVNLFMADLEKESHLLGIPLRTRHNEVAPAQYECAPQFESVNIAVDHNALLMDLMTKVARRHNFVVLLHEKPFEKINGSGKHCNWSLATSDGENLLSPGKNPVSNLKFLTFFVSIIKAVHSYDDILRASIASASNDHRLGANEAPPAIISVFIGNYLTKVLETIEQTGDIKENVEELLNNLSFKVPRVPQLDIDNTDRNRTSPFAFTGSKFEFRAVGSSSNPSASMTVLNTIVGHQLKVLHDEVSNELEKNDKLDLNSILINILKRYIAESKSILFEGNNYSDEWKQEAVKRGLKNIDNTPEALGAYVEDKTAKLFENANIMNSRELHARYEIMLETYIKQVQIESRIMGEIADSMIIPAALTFQNTLVENYRNCKELGLETQAKIIREIIDEISEHVSELKKKVDRMIEERKIANNIEDIKQKALAYCKNIKGLFDPIRYHADKLELLIDDKLWALPKYREILFVK